MPSWAWPGFAPRGRSPPCWRASRTICSISAPISPPRPAAARHKGALRIVASQVTRLEREIDRLNAKLKPLDSFVLPGGSELAAALHLARTVVRRAERHVVALAKREAINPEALRYLNRLSDHLFVLARAANAKGKKDLLWKPGANR